MTVNTSSREANYQRFLDQFHYLLEYQQKRSDSISSRAIALLQGTGVMLALEAGLNIRNTSNVADKVLVITSMGLLAGSAFISSLVVLPREGKGPDPSSLRDAFMKLRVNPDVEQWKVTEQMAMMIIGSESEESIFESLTRQANDKGRLLRKASWFFLGALLPASILIIRGAFR
jgi:hypothetical protein